MRRDCLRPCQLAMVMEPAYTFINKYTIINTVSLSPRSQHITFGQNAVSTSTKVCFYCKVLAQMSVDLFCGHKT